MKAGKLRSIWILLSSAAIILYTSIQTLIITQFQNSRSRIDKIAQVMSKRILNRINLTYTLHDPHHLTLQNDRRYIVMCNHASHYDIPLSFMAIHGSLRMMAKRELFKVPIWGRAMKKAEFIPLDRDNREQAKKDLAFAKEKMASGIIIWIAPEGTRSKTGALQPFKKGGFMLAYQTDAIIIPMGIRGSFNILPPKTWDFQLHQQAEIHIGKPIDTLQYKIKDRAKLMQDVESSIRTLAGL